MKLEYEYGKEQGREKGRRYNFYVPSSPLLNILEKK
jgi:hypothetical protein